MNREPTPTGSRRPEFDTLAERLWWARETAPLTQAELAAHLGISKRTVQNYESGAQQPPERRALLWANACDVDFHWLVGDTYTNPGAPHRAMATSTRGMSSASNPGCVRFEFAENAVYDLVGAA